LATPPVSPARLWLDGKWDYLRRLNEDPARPIPEVQWLIYRFIKFLLARLRLSLDQLANIKDTRQGRNVAYPLHGLLFSSGVRQPRFRTTITSISPIREGASGVAADLSEFPYCILDSDWCARW
jgi:hypothetical protein